MVVAHREFPNVQQQWFVTIGHRQFQAHGRSGLQQSQATVPQGGGLCRMQNFTIRLACNLLLSDAEESVEFLVNQQVAPFKILEIHNVGTVI